MSAAKQNVLTNLMEQITKGQLKDNGIVWDYYYDKS